MTVQEMHNWFEQLLDKYQAPYFTEAEIDRFINRAQIEYINSFLPDGEGLELTPEQNAHILENLNTLVFETAALNMSGAGEITDVNIQSALDTASGSTEAFIKILNVSSEGLPVKFVRHNDFYKFQQNDFKQASAAYPQYKRVSGKFIFLPVDVSDDIKFTLLKYPREVALGTTTDSDLPDSTHNNIIAIAINSAGIATRDDALAQLNQLQSNV